MDVVRLTVVHCCAELLSQLSNARSRAAAVRNVSAQLQQLEVQLQSTRFASYYIYFWFSVCFTYLGPVYYLFCVVGVFSPVCFELSVPVQVIVCKDSSPK